LGLYRVVKTYNMPTINQLSSEIIEDLEKYKVSDDSDLDPELIKDKIVSAHISIFGQFVKEGLSLDAFYQIVPCIELSCFEKSCIVSGMTFTSTSYLYKGELPPLMLSIGTKAIKYFGLHGMDKNIDQVDLLGFISSNGARYTSKEPVWTQIGQEALLKNVKKGFTLALLVGILSDPRDACDWDDDTSQFPTPSPDKIKILVKNSITQTPGLPDLQNDAQRALGQQPKTRQQERRTDSNEEQE
jgi:hypothetical protein